MKHGFPRTGEKMFRGFCANCAVILRISHAFQNYPFFNALHDFANSAYSAREKHEFQAGEIDDSTECHTRFV